MFRVYISFLYLYAILARLYIITDLRIIMNTEQVGIWKWLYRTECPVSAVIWKDRCNHVKQITVKIAISQLSPRLGTSQM